MIWVLCRDDLESSEESDTEMEVDGSYISGNKARHDLMIRSEVMCVRMLQKSFLCRPVFLI